MKKLMLPPVAWIASIIVMFVLHEAFPIIHMEPKTWRSILGAVIFCAAIGVTIWHKRLFQRQNTNIDTFKEPDRLIDSGLFKYIRNPMYTGFTVSLASIALLGGALSPWLIVAIFFILADKYYIPLEEKMMRNKFGKEYDEYQYRTRRWI